MTVALARSIGVLRTKLFPTLLDCCEVGGGGHRWVWFHGLSLRRFRTRGHVLRSHRGPGSKFRRYSCRVRVICPFSIGKASVPPPHGVDLVRP